MEFGFPFGSMFFVLLFLLLSLPHCCVVFLGLGVFGRGGFLGGLFWGSGPTSGGPAGPPLRIGWARTLIVNILISFPRLRFSFRFYVFRSSVPPALPSTLLRRVLGGFSRGVFWVVLLRGSGGGVGGLAGPLLTRGRPRTIIVNILISFPRRSFWVWQLITN